MLHMSLDMTNCVLYFKHNAAESTLKVQREWNKGWRIKKVKPLFLTHGFLSVWGATIRTSNSSGRSLSWNQSSAFWNWLHRGVVAPCVGDRVEGNGQHLCYQLSWLKLPGKRLIWTAAVVEGTQHFPTFLCLFLHYMVCFSQTSVWLSTHDGGGLWKPVA